MRPALFTVLLLTLMLLTAALGLTACSDPPKLQAIETQLLEISAKPKGETETLPNFFTRTTVQANLSQLKKRDPFLPVKNTTNKLEALQFLEAPGPDLNRLLGLLEEWDLAQLSFSGSMQRGKSTYGLIITPNKQLVAVKQGDRMGKNHGIITYLNQTSITLLELIPHGSEWQERKQIITLSK